MELLQFEMDLWEGGYQKIACIDEVGRGCLFGSVLAAAVIMPKGLYIEGVKDSKKLTPKKREELYEIIKEKSIAMGIGTVSPEVIDEINIKNATKLAMKKAILNIKDKEGNIVKPDFLLIDAEKINMEIPQKPIIKGDSLCHGISVASIVAKVIRDRMCNKWAEEYPHYGLEKHKGYGTRMHVEALMKYGPSQMHRRSFLKKIII